MGDSWAVVLLAVLASVSPGFGAAQAAPPCTKAAALADVTADRHTTREIERRIARDESLAPLARRVKVSTSDGIVTLRGTIERDEDRLVLASLAESAPGVRHVDDRLEVREWPEPPSALRAR